MMKNGLNTLWATMFSIIDHVLIPADTAITLWNCNTTPRKKKEDYLFINHMLVLAKQHIYECRNKCTYPSFTVF